MKKIIIRYQGGMGNQMFEYATKICIEKKGNIVKDDLSFYYDNPSFMPLVIHDVFSNVKISNFIRPVWLTKFVRKFYQFRNKYFFEVGFVYYHEKLFDKSGWYEGYWQSFKYYEKNREEIIKAFCFPKITIERVNNIANEIQRCNSVSIHIRGGDYLNSTNSPVYGGICTKEYYEKAIECIKDTIPDPVFYVFSDDINWAKENINNENLIFVEHLDDYCPDWVDMYLMSICRHNIIANSSFSWWGAWLNCNQNKLVVAPARWCNTYSNDEVCPSEWVRI